MADNRGAVAASAEIDDLLRLLADTAGRLEALTRGLDDARLSLPPSEGAWSVNEILGHLRACADVWGGSIQTMIERDHPTLRYVSPRARMRKAGYGSQPFAESLRAYTTQRAELLRTLSALAPADWARGATFSGTTRGHEQTILSYARRIVDHEQEHCAHVQATLQQP